MGSDHYSETGRKNKETMKHNLSYGRPVRWEISGWDLGDLGSALVVRPWESPSAHLGFGKIST